MWQDPNANAHFQLAAEDAQRRIVSIAQTKKNTGIIRFAAELRQNDDDRQRIARIREPHLSQLIEDMRIEMARFGIVYNGINKPLEVVYLEDRAACDESLTKEALLTHMMFMRRASVLLLEHLRRAIRQSERPANPKSDPDMSEDQPQPAPAASS